MKLIWKSERNGAMTGHRFGPWVINAYDDGTVYLFLPRAEAHEFKSVKAAKAYVKRICVRVIKAAIAQLDGRHELFERLWA